MKTFLVSKVFWSLLALVSLFFQFPLDALESLDFLQHHAWTIEDGLPMNTVNSITQDAEGYIWIATEAGVARFDGVHFEVFHHENTPVFTSDVCIHIIADHRGTIWIGTRGGGLLYYQGQEFHAWKDTQGILSNDIWYIMESPDHSLWIGHRTGLARIVNGKLTDIPLPANLETPLINCLLEDHNGRTWAGCRSGELVLIHEKGDSFESELIDTPGLVINAIYEDRKGNTWVATSQNGLHCYQYGRKTSFTLKDGLTDMDIQALFEDHAGNLWIGTYGSGLNILTPNNPKITPFNTQETFSNDVILCFFQDREGTLWIGTNGGGLNSFRETKIKTFSIKNGLSYHNIYGVFQDKKGLVWSGTKGYGVNCFNIDKNRFHSLTTQNGLSSDVVVSITQDLKGALWFGTLGGGVTRFQNGRFQKYSTRQGLSYNHTRAIYTDPSGDIWVGTITGILHRFDPEKQIFIPVADIKARINTMYKDSRGTLWLGTLGRGICTFKNNQIEVFDTQDGLSDNVVTCIHEDEIHPGVFWIGTIKGLNRFQDGKSQPIFKKDGLPDTVSYWILEDHKHNFWISSNRGIYCLSRAELDHFFQGETQQVIPLVFGREAGMLSIECNGGNHPGGWKTTDGRLWFPTTNGISVIDPLIIGVNKIPPPVVIEKININGLFQLAKKNHPVEVPPGKSNLEIHYTALSFIAPHDIRFKYKLHGYDKEFIDAGNNRLARYASVPPGHYLFQVIAGNSDGIWNNTGSAIAFDFKPTLFQTLLFKILMMATLLIISLTLAFLVRTHLQHRKIKSKGNRSTSLEPEETERTIKKLLYLIEIEKIYKNPDLSIRSLSSHLLISPRILSQIINDHLNTNFHEFINRHRVKEAQKIITSPNRPRHSILEIAYEVGYNSKSAFNRAFKSFTHMTPSEYRKKLKLKN